MSEENKKLAEEIAEAIDSRPVFSEEAQGRKDRFVNLFACILDRLDAVEKKCERPMMTIVHSYYPPAPSGHFACPAGEGK